MKKEGLKVLMVSSDRQTFVPESAVALRLKEYGAKVEELHIVILSDRTHGFKNVELAKNVWVYPTDSISKILRPFDAAGLGKRIVREKKFVRGRSVITAQDPFECGWAGLKIKKKWRLPLEVQLHTDPFSPYFSGPLNRVRKFLARTVLAEADSVRVVSESLKSQITKHKLNANVSVLPIYIDKERIENARLSFDLHARYGWHFIILAVSRLAPEKNLPLALEALALVRKKFPEAGMVIVGSGREEKSLKSKVKGLKLEGAVEFAGWQNDQNDLASYYKSANLFLQTSLFEGYGLSLIEAGLSGLPIVTTKVGIAEELEHGKDAYIFETNEPEEFAQGIIELIENNFKRENLRINCRRTLDSKLISKEEYLKRLASNWENTAKFIS